MTRGEKVKLVMAAHVDQSKAFLRDQFAKMLDETPAAIPRIHDFLQFHVDGIGKEEAASDITVDRLMVHTLAKLASPTWNELISGLHANILDKEDSDDA